MEYLKKETSEKPNDAKTTNPDREEKIEEILDQIPELASDPKKKTVLHRMLKLECESFSGPLPPPDALRKYGEILPDAPDRIIKMAERQGQHRIEIEKTLVNGNSSRENKGLWFGFIIGMTGIIGGIILILNDKSVTGFITTIGTIASLAGTFIYTKHKESKVTEATKQK